MNKIDLEFLKKEITGGFAREQVHRRNYAMDTGQGREQESAPCDSALQPTTVFR